MALRMQYLKPGSREWLEQAVTISLFTDARLPDGSPVPDNSNDRRGHWGDTFMPVGESLGSLLWTLRREKLTTATINQARDMAIDALRWLLATPYVRALNVLAERYRSDSGGDASNTWTLALGISLTLPDGSILPITESLNAA